MQDLTKISSINFMEEIHLPTQRKGLRRQSGNRRPCEVHTSFINDFSSYP
ncbi:hypothetical protein SELSPUOL_00599 [Selenomonas sputigena ATCC 35185]|uniref:Uncharacterized protein n=1 Tax=Selenomonas sputigena (strain ATCC 35185 / DSM 20758 / CCUG 44933 / VPI D19B-28) TaxID=546271 RepID=C9LT19_SELS3|nr:hypothetical protein SELSPUOL_00599 [Selenomonas sputigena ATCC 35185]